jgi:hypothetical protein
MGMEGIEMDKVQTFLAVMREKLSAYPWAQADPGRLEQVMVFVEDTLNGSHSCNIDGASWKAAWKAIGMKGKPTYKGLHSLKQTA